MMNTNDAGLGMESNEFQKGQWVFINPDEGAFWWRTALLNEETVKKFPFKVTGYKVKGTMVWYRCEKNGAVVDNIPQDRVSLADGYEPENPKWIERAKTDAEFNEGVSKKETVEVVEVSKLSDIKEVKEDEEVIIQPDKNDKPIASKTKRKTV